VRLVVQRVRRASVTVDGEVVGVIGEGLLVLVGFGRADGPGFADGPVCGAMLEKLCDLRIFPDEAGKLNVGLRETGGALLLVSQFTLYATCRKGRRPSFSEAAAPDVARDLYARLVARAEAAFPGKVAGGRFGADMDVELVNWGPVTIVLDSADFAPGEGS
jgi:D-tyrosyl-tRNA(Tyr) deacylase